MTACLSFPLGPAVDPDARQEPEPVFARFVSHFAHKKCTMKTLRIPPLRHQAERKLQKDTAAM